MTKLTKRSTSSLSGDEKDLIDEVGENPDEVCLKYIVNYQKS